MRQPPSVASRGCWRKNRSFVPIPGTGKLKHLEENIDATTLDLSTRDLKEIDNILSEFKVHGGRMDEQQMKVVASGTGYPR